MDGLLSDSNDSSSSSMTDIGPGVSLNMLTSHGSNNTNGHHHHLHSHQQNHHLLHTTNGQQQLNHHNNNLMNDQLYYTSSHQHLQPQHQQSQQHSQQHHQQVQDHSNGSNKRKIVDGEASTSKSTTETSKKKTSPPNGKKTKGRVKIKMEFIDNKLRRYTTFSKRKTGIMKKVRLPWDWLLVLMAFWPKFCHLTTKQPESKPNSFCRRTSCLLWREHKSCYWLLRKRVTCTPLLLANFNQWSPVMQGKLWSKRAWILQTLSCLLRQGTREETMVSKGCVQQDSKKLT